MSNDPIFDVFLGPLALLEIDAPWSEPGAPPPDYTAIMNMLCTPGVERSPSALAARYREISTEPHRLNAAPHQDQILEKLVWPLRHAKASYMISNYLGTISLCGMVGEMTAILFFETAKISLNGQDLDEPRQAELLGSRFERLGQERRINVLSSLGLIDEETKQALVTVKDRRRGYLHRLSEKHDEIASHAVDAFHAAVTAVVKVIGQDIQDGKLVLRPAMFRYLQDQGLITQAGT